ncbi:hypothetical protein BG74_04205 [Sodalis-like endosymbiont of Proechinophthirus fluctus]|nr:hypothetical protein BG74_04205 [Sodalis-like endosymbiont of Proechinophthirus fluctus]
MRHRVHRCHHIQIEHLYVYYILSDSYHLNIHVAEQKTWMELCKETIGTGRIFIAVGAGGRMKRKSGNIDDFCRR